MIQVFKLFFAVLPCLLVDEVSFEAVDLLHLPSPEAEQLKERWRYRNFASAAPIAQLADLYDIEPK